MMGVAALLVLERIEDVEPAHPEGHGGGQHPERPRRLAPRIDLHSAVIW